MGLEVVGYLWKSAKRLSEGTVDTVQGVFTSWMTFQDDEDFATSGTLTLKQDRKNG